MEVGTDNSGELCSPPCLTLNVGQNEMKNTLRKLQDDLANAGCRLRQISHAPEGKPVFVGFENWAGYVAAVSIMGFPIGCGMAIYLKEHGKSPFPGVYIAVASWAVCLLALVIKNKLIKTGWIVVEAKCIDREIREVAAKGGTTWAVRLLCEFTRDGLTTRCTPTVHWSTFTTESAARAFLGTRIDPGGGCTLRINPRNPREANLVARQIK